MVERVGAIQARHGADAFGVISTGQLVTEEFYTLGKLVQLGFGTNNYDGNTTLCMASAVSGYKTQLRQRRPSGMLRRSGQGRRDSADRREHRREPSHPLPAPAGESAARR